MPLAFSILRLFQKSAPKLASVTPVGRFLPVTSALLASLWQLRVPQLRQNLPRTGPLHYCAVRFPLNILNIQMQSIADSGADSPAGI